MAINFTDLFTRIGKAAWLVKLVNEFQGSGTTAVIATDVDTEWVDFYEQYDADSSKLRAVVKSLTDSLESAKSGLNTLPAAVKTAVQNTLIEFIDADNPQSSKTLLVAIDELIRQMVTATESIDENTITATPSYATTGGSANTSGVITSVIQGDGLNLQYCKAEDLIIVPTSGTAATLTGEHSGTGDLMREDYTTTGTGASTTLTVSNKLTDGPMENWTAGVADSWTTVVGDATSILKETTNFYRGLAAMNFLGDGAELTSVKQALTSLEAKTPYALIVYTRTDAVAPAAGVLKIELVDDTGAAVTSDEESTSNSLTIDVTSETATYAAHTAVFRLKDPLPTTAMLYIRLTTAITSAKNVWIDSIQLTKMSQAYSGGPFVALMQSAADWSLDDRITIPVTNDESSEMARWCERFFDLRSQGRQLPYSGTATQADALIA